MIDPTTEWIASHFNEISKKYAGKYIAIVNNEVVASGSRTSEATEKARKKVPNKEPVIMKVPSKHMPIQLELAFPWAKYDVEGLDIHYLPICRMSIQKTDGKWLEFGFKIDTGSDVTCLNKTDCIDLGYTITERDTEHFTDINNEKHRIYVKELNVRFNDNYVIKRVPIGFSAKRLDILLLGRAKIFDSLSFCFDCKSRQTVIIAPDWGSGH